MEKEPRRFRRHWPISKLFPNMVTLAGMCCGLSSIRYAIGGQWETAIWFILAAAIIDAMDGSIARLLKSTSTYGSQLDSLSDFACFGVAPGLVIYMWQLQHLRGFGWAIALFFAVCCILRLARFNTNLAEEKEEAGWKKRFFTGVPAPMGALLALVPLICTLQWETSITRLPLFSAFYLPVIAALMVSRIPTLSLKGLKIRHDLVLPVMVLFGGGIVAFIIEPWPTVLAILSAYVVSMPLGALRYRRMARDRAAGESPQIIRLAGRPSD